MRLWRAELPCNSIAQHLILTINESLRTVSSVGGGGGSAGPLVQFGGPLVAAGPYAAA